MNADYLAVCVRPSFIDLIFLPWSSNLTSFLTLELEYEEDGDANEDPNTMDVVGRAELKDDFSLNTDEESPLPWYADVLVQSFLLVNGISRRKNPCDGSSNFISNPFELPVIEKNWITNFEAFIQ